MRFYTKTKKLLEQYPTIRTSRSVNNPLFMLFQIQFDHRLEIIDDQFYSDYKQPVEHLLYCFFV
jgi:hypothetical protein